MESYRLTTFFLQSKHPVISNVGRNYWVNRRQNTAKMKYLPFLKDYVQGQMSIWQRLSMLKLLVI